MMYSNPTRRVIRGALVLASLSFAACGGGGHHTSSTTSGFSNFDLVMTDAPADDLLAFRATINEIHLRKMAGGETANLLDAPVRVELIGLHDRFAWLVSDNVPADTYLGARIVFAAGSYDARRADGTSVAVTATANDVTLDFSSPVTMDASVYRQAEADLDLRNSLTGSISSPPITFQPSGGIKIDNQDVALLDELKGLVSTINGNSDSFVINAFVDDDQLVPLGQVAVRVGTGTVLVKDDGGLFASRAAFFSALVANTTQVEVHGSLDHGAVSATRIEIEDNQAGGGDDNLVKIEGLVTKIGPGNSLEMSVAEVEKGSSIVSAASGGSTPAKLTVAWNASTVFFREEGTITTAAALVVGQKIKTKFATFTNPPFTASRIEIDDEEAKNDGTITSVAGAPTTVIVRLESTAPAMQAGLVASASTDVTVDLAGATAKLDAGIEPTITGNDLLTGLRVEVRGAVAGTPANPTIDATRLFVKAGQITNATVMTIDEPDHRFTTSGGSIEETFGSGVVAGPQTVIIASNCQFQGDASAEAGFFDLFQNLQAGDVLVVKIHGLGTGDANTIGAWEIDATVED